MQTSNLITRTQHNACSRAIKRGLSAVRIPAPQHLSEWADNHFYLSPESSAIEGPWETIPFQTEIMNAISNEDIRIIDWLKCARVGYTKILMAACAYFVEHKKRSTAIYQPTDSDAKEFSKSEVDPMIRDVKVLREALRSDPERRGRNNTVDLKQFLGALLYIRGGHSNRSYRRLTIDVVMYDELEGFERDIDGEGDPVSLGDARITNSAYPKSIRGSTPRLAHDSLIYAEAERARHMFKYWVRCLSCEQPQPMVFAQIRWDKDKPETVRYECEHCAAHWRYSDLRELLINGFWGTDTGYSIRKGALIDPEDMQVDWPRHIAFHIWAAYSPFFTWQELVEEWLEATQASKEGDTRKLKSFTNTRLAEPWEEKGEQVNFDSLFMRRETYDRLPQRALLVTAQFDVQANRLEGEMIAWGRGEESWGVEYITHYGDPTQPEVWRELEETIHRKFRTDDGRELQIAGVVLDTGFLPDHAYNFYRQTTHPRVFCIKGMGGADKPIVSAPHQRKSGRSKAAVPLFLMGADVCKTIVYKRLQLNEPGPGYCHFPDTYDEEYFRGLTAEKRIIKFRRGFEVQEWIKTRPRNEPLDVRAMGVMCIAILRPAWDALDPAGQKRQTSDTEQAPYIPHAHHTRPRNRNRSYGDRWRNK